MPKTNRLLLLAALAMLISGFSFQSCTRNKCKTTQTYTKYTPVYMSYDEMRAPDAVKSSGIRTIENPGKIYFWNHFIFINEYMKGVHIVDNGNPSNPQKIGFVEIPGNIDIAVKGGILYADSYVDLLAIDISSPSNATELSRVEDVIPYEEWQHGVALDPSLGVVKEWLTEEVTETIEADCPSSGWGWGGGFREELSTTQGGSGSTSTTTDNGRNPAVGAGGSMARFALVDEYLYIATSSELLSFALSTPSSPLLSSTVQSGWQVETIFPHEGNLFLGTTSGMMIYDLSSPGNPSYVSEFAHATACDPVVVDGDRAYVTLRGGTPCGGFQDQLDIIDVSTLTSPVLISSHDMYHPLGLGVKDNTLFLCDDTEGLKVYDVTDDVNIKLLNHQTGIQSYDVIPLDESLLMIGENGFYQYDYTNPSDLRLLSSILVGQ